MPVGPFEIEPDQITRLDTRFTTFANKLLEVERAAQGLDGYLLSINVNENAPDGGVDAALRGSPGTSWTPEGDTVFQFKRSHQTKAGSVNELAGATEVKVMLEAGGSYILMLGGDTVPDSGVKDRQEALVAKAVELNFIGADGGDRIRVYDANAIARWASEYPSLAIDPILGGVQAGAIDIERWSGSRVHQGPYFADDTRARQIDDLRERLASGEPVDVRLQGESGMGKTRMALEALTDDRFRSLVAYIDDASQVGGGLIESLVDHCRHAIVVVDECPAEQHVKLTAKLPTNPGVKLITIGDVGASRSSGPILGLEALADDAMDELLRTRFPALSPEARRFVRTNSIGAPGGAIWLGEAVERTPDGQAADLIERDNLEQFISTSFPEGEPFFFAAVLALFERVGWDRDLRTQMELLASFAGGTPADLERAMRELTSRGLARTQGRYRAVEPLPVAVYLAAEGWRQHGQRILDELLPVLDGDMAGALFRRLAQLGRFDPARAVLPRLLASGGPFQDLKSIDENHLGALLTQLAIVLPDEVTTHLSMLIEEASVEQLSNMRKSRRDLVWTLEKLVWHSRTFEQAADALLKLALAENETYANNATGTWLTLFGGALPGTAASPSQRAEYLARVATDPRPEVRLLVVQATQPGLQIHESVMVSGEVQGGVLVEPRGAPTNWIDLGDYRRALLAILDRLRADEDSAVADAATAALLDALHQLIDDPFVGDDFADILSTFTGDALRQLRVAIEHLSSMYSRHGTADDRQVLQGLQVLGGRLPPADEGDTLQLLLQLQRWDLGEGELEARMQTAVLALPPGNRLRLVDLLGQEVPAAWELGHALATSEGESDALAAALTERYSINPSALLGYLAGLVDAGDGTAFDRFLEGPLSASLTPLESLSMAARGPVTEASRQRILEGATTLPIHDAASGMFGWGRHLEPDELELVIADWTARIASQDDYDALINWLSLTIRDETVTARLADPIWRVVQARATYPDMSHGLWEWGRLAKHAVDGHALSLLRLLLDLVEQGHVMIHSGDDDARLIRGCLEREPLEGWRELGDRLENPEGWRLTMQLRGWVQNSVPVAILDQWIGEDIERARTVASIASPGGADPSELAILLLDRFGKDDQVCSSLRATFASGSWTGPWSSRLTGQIEQLASWQARPELPLGARRWAKITSDGLIREREEVLEREAEEFR